VLLYILLNSVLIENDEHYTIQRLHKIWFVCATEF